MSVAEEAFSASQSMWDVALRGARDNLSDVRMSGSQFAIKRAEENCANVEIACIYSNAALKTVELTNRLGLGQNGMNRSLVQCENCGDNPCLDGQYVRRSGHGFRVLEVRSGRVGMVKNKTKKGQMKIKWDNGQWTNGFEIFDPVAGEFLLRYCCREDGIIEGEIEGNEDSKLTILAKKTQQIVDVTSAAGNENESTILLDDQVRVISLLDT